MDWTRRLAKQNLRRLRSAGRRLKTNAQAVSDRFAGMWEQQQRMFSVHIPKTGGTTFLTVLANHFGDRLVQDYELPREEVNRLIGGRTTYCVHGHYWTTKYADVPDATYVTWLRDPIDRLISHYNFWHNFRFPHDPVWRRVHYDKLDFLSFAKLRYISNEQSRYIAGKSLDEFSFVGIMEMFNEGMELFRDQFAIPFDAATLPRLRDSRQFRTVFDRSMLSRKEEMILRDAHAADYELYMHGLRHFRANSQKSWPSAAVVPEGQPAPKPSYGKLVWGGQYMQPETEKSALANRTAISDRLKNAGVSMIRGTYYYGDSWPVNVWDTFRPELADRLLKTVVDNGYNTIILLIPAGIELVQRLRPEFYEAFRRDLAFLLERIRAHGLNYAYRIAYAWEGYPVEQHRGTYMFDHLCPGPIQDNYLRILSDLWQDVKDDPKFLMAFTTWEDMISSPIHVATRATPEGKAAMAAEIGFTGSKKGIPDLKDPELYPYLEHIDDTYIQMMYRIKEVFPPVTLEVRVDHTPAYDAGGTMHPFIHHKQMVEMDSDILGTYFGTYMMIGPTPRTAEQGIEGMNRAHHNVRIGAPLARTFVDQFNFVMREKVFNHFEAIELPEMRRFLEKSVDWFDERSVGYATWSFVDYMMDIVSNATFRLGMEGWTVAGSAELAETPQGRVVTMQDGSSLTGTNIRHYSPWIKDGWIILEAELDAGAEMTVDLSPTLSFTFAAADFDAPGYGTLPRLVRPFEGQTTGFRLSVKGGAARVTRASMGSDVCSNGGLDVRFAENEVSRLVAEFNSWIAAKEAKSH